MTRTFARREAAIRVWGFWALDGYWASMPEISRFFGIVIQMYFDDHAPPHFHARYGAKVARLGLGPVARLDGDLPPRALRLALEWGMLHEQELLENWRRLRAGRTPVRIAPLE